MNKKGFTLIEIIITIALIALVSLMFTNSFETIQKNTRKSEYSRMLNKIKNAVSVYVANDKQANSDLFAEDGYVLVPISNLVKTGNLAYDLVDPTTQSAIDQTKMVYAIRDQYGSIIIDYPHSNSGTNECYLETTPLLLPKSTSIVSIYYNNLNNIGLRLIKTNGSITSLISGTSIIMSSNNIITNKAGTYTINYKYLDCNNSSIWRLGTRKVIFY